MNRFQHPALNDMYAALDEVENIEKALEELNQQLRAAKQQLNDKVAALPAQIGDNEDLHNEIFHYLYWFVEQISGADLKQIFNMVNPSRGDERGKTKTKSGKGIIQPASFEVLCTTCNQPFEMFVSGRGDLQYKQKYLSGKWTVSCTECQARTNAQFNQRYQEEQAARQRRLDELHTMPYREYLQTPEWQETRKRAMKRAGFRCQVCNKYGVRLNVHHRTYERRGYEDNRDLITLCHGCHQIFHENGSLAEW